LPGGLGGYLATRGCTQPGRGRTGRAHTNSNKAAVNPTILKLVRAGCQWLEQQARQRGQPAFAELNEQDRVAVVGLAENATAKSLPRVFFEYTREDAFFFYYGRPESWTMLDYPGPPQPLGFTDFARPPKGSA